MTSRKGLRRARGRARGERSRVRWFGAALSVAVGAERVVEKRSGVALNAVRFGRRRSARRINNHVSAATGRCCRLVRCGSRCSCLWSALRAARGAVEAAVANRPSSRRRRAGNSTDRHVSFGAALVDATAATTARRMGDHALPGRVGASFARGGTTLQMMTGSRSAVS